MLVSAPPKPGKRLRRESIILYIQICSVPCLVPRRIFFHVRKGRREGEKRQDVASPLFFFPFPWSHALRQQSLAFRAHPTSVWKRSTDLRRGREPCIKEHFLWKSLRKQDIQSICNWCHIIEHFICKPDKRFTRVVNTVGGEGGGARVAQWWEHSPPTNVAQIPILASTPYGGWVCCWFSPLLRDVFLRVLRFPPPPPHPSP